MIDPDTTTVMQALKMAADRCNEKAKAAPEGERQALVADATRFRATLYRIEAGDAAMIEFDDWPEPY